ncbi:hypothetical protein [Shewanella polaris]|uniref:hypothetical protein n=1 Tax=Shewanella polaris TaxID=2588449 RepID=UPI00142EE476|nr:hypothetical protein [Shewanella polaris]
MAAFEAKGIDGFLRNNKSKIKVDCHNKSCDLTSSTKLKKVLNVGVCYANKSGQPQ